MIRHALIINFEGKPLIVIQHNPYKDTKEQLDDYAKDYAFDREKLTATVTQVMGFDEVEDLLRMLPREGLPQGDTITRFYELRKLSNIDAKALLRWTVAYTNGEQDLALTQGATAAESIREMLTFLGIDHSHIKPGTSTKYTG